MNGISKFHFLNENYSKIYFDSNFTVINFQYLDQISSWYIHLAANRRQVIIWPNDRQAEKCNNRI